VTNLRTNATAEIRISQTDRRFPGEVPVDVDDECVRPLVPMSR
jgi:hypothetical protein